LSQSGYWQDSTQVFSNPLDFNGFKRVSKIFIENRTYLTELFKGVFFKSYILKMIGKLLWQAGTRKNNLTVLVPGPVYFHFVAVYRR
jgi:hypothetical protein